MKNGRRQGLGVIAALCLLVVGCQPEDKQTVAPNVGVLRKFEVMDTKGIVDRFRISVGNPQDYMVSSGIYNPEARAYINSTYPVAGSEDHTAIISELHRRIQHYDSLPASHPVTPLFPAESLEAMDSFFTQAVPLAIVHLLNVLEATKTTDTSAVMMETDAAITALFDDRVLLKERLRWLLFPLRDNPGVVFRIVTIDSNNEPLFFAADVSDFHYRAFVDSEKAPEYIGIHSENMASFIQKATIQVPGFDNEHLFFIVLHELLHTIVFAGDDSYHGDEKEEQGAIGAINRYEVDNLVPSENLNADNYAVLIYIALRNLHNEGVLDLAKY